MRKEYFIVIDTETANSVEQPLPYDVGWIVTDRHGNIFEERSYVVAEIYCSEKELMQSAYYAEKLPQYEKDIRKGSRTLASIFTIRKQFFKDFNNYHCKRVFAYNMNFDKRALNNDIRYITKSWERWFFPRETEYCCIWNIACQLLLTRKSYIKFAEENKLFTDKGNIQTNAESCYKYITKNPYFVESHTGLEDVLIETAILNYCFRQHKKFDSKPYTCCWQSVQKKRKEITVY